jgi:hypothetical protein
MVNMSTNGNNPTFDEALGSLPTKLREKLIKTYQELKSSFVRGEFESSGLRAGKFCEVALRVLQNDLTGTFIPLGNKVPNYKSECERLEQLDSSTGPESLRILMPRALNFLYTLRNKRGIGHVGGDIDANEIDAATCVRLADWCLSELIRVLHHLSIEEAQSLLDSIAERRLPLVWEIFGKKRVLQTKIGYKAQVLLLLYSQPGNGVPLEDLLEWTENPRKDNFVRTVISPLHKQRLVLYDRETDFVVISPTGSKKVEDEMLPSLLAD